MTKPGLTKRNTASPLRQRMIEDTVARLLQLFDAGLQCVATTSLADVR